MSDIRDDFGGFTYKQTVQFFMLVVTCSKDKWYSGETKGDWFCRCHKITGKEFAEIIKQRETPKEFERIMKGG